MTKEMRTAYIPALANMDASNLQTMEPLFLILHCLL